VNEKNYLAGVVLSISIFCEVGSRPLTNYRGQGPRHPRFFLPGNRVMHMVPRGPMPLPSTLPVPATGEAYLAINAPPANEGPSAFYEAACAKWRQGMEYAGRSFPGGLPYLSRHKMKTWDGRIRWNNQDKVDVFQLQMNPLPNGQSI